MPGKPRNDPACGPVYRRLTEALTEAERRFVEARQGALSDA